MFQNINEGTIENQKYKENENEKKKIDLFTNVLQIRNIPIYIIAFMISMVGITGDISPFSISILGACIVNNIPLLGVVLLSSVGSAIKFGISGLLGYILTALVLIVTMFIIKPRYSDSEKNQKIYLYQR